MDSEEIKDLLNQVIVNGNQAGTLLNDILTQSKNNLLWQSKFRDRVAYSEFASDATKQMHVLAENLRVHLNCKVSSPHKKACANDIVLDRTKTTQMIINCTYFGLRTFLP